MEQDPTQQRPAPVTLGVPRGDTWELGGQNNGCFMESLDGQTLFGYVLVPTTSLENGKFVPDHQYWLRLNAQQPLPNAFRLRPRTSPLPQSALDRNDWEDHPSSVFDGSTTTGYQPVQLGSNDTFYRIDTTIDGQDQVSAWLLRQIGGGPVHTWHGKPGALQADAQDPDALLIATETTIRFTADSQPQSGTQLHPLV